MKKYCSACGDYALCPKHENEFTMHPKAKTAEEIADEVWQHLHKTLFIEILKSYADSVAEERVKDILAGNENFVQRSNAVLKIAMSESFKDGQERMRERAAQWTELCCEFVECESGCLCAKGIRALETEVPDCKQSIEEK